MLVLLPNTTEIFQVLVTEIFKINRGISRSIMKSIFQLRAEHPYNLRCISRFFASLVSTLFHAKESMSFLGPKIWSFIPETFKNTDSLENLKIVEEVEN